MKSVTLYTDDCRLRREIQLLLPNDYILSNDGSGILIWDADSVPMPHGCHIHLILTRSGRFARSDIPVLRRPFAIADLIACLTRVPEKAELLPLTPTEKRLLAILKEADGAPCARQELIERVWGEDGTDSLLNLYIHYLREKLEKDGKRRIFSARGKGYYYKC